MNKKLLILIFTIASFFCQGQILETEQIPNPHLVTFYKKYKDVRNFPTIKEFMPVINHLSEINEIVNSLDDQEKENLKKFILNLLQKSRHLFHYANRVGNFLLRSKQLPLETIIQLILEYFKDADNLVKARQLLGQFIEKYNDFFDFNDLDSVSILLYDFYHLYKIHLFMNIEEIKKDSSTFLFNLLKAHYYKNVSPYIEPIDKIQNILKNGIKFVLEQYKQEYNDILKKEYSDLNEKKENLLKLDQKLSDLIATCFQEISRFSITKFFVAYQSIIADTNVLKTRLYLFYFKNFNDLTNKIDVWQLAEWTKALKIVCYDMPKNYQNEIQYFLVNLLEKIGYTIPTHKAQHLHHIIKIAEIEINKINHALNLS